MNVDKLRRGRRTAQKRRRVGRGAGSTLGKTSGRGHKGQKQRESVRPGFEGGQNPLYRRLPKLKGVSKSAMNRGLFRRQYAIVNVGQLERLAVDGQVSPEQLQAQGVMRRKDDGLRVLGQGRLGVALTVRAHHFSASARRKIEAVGGVAEEIQ